MTKKYYPEIDSNPDFPAIEEKILSFWKEQKVFEASVENRPASRERGAHATAPTRGETSQGANINESRQPAAHGGAPLRGEASQGANINNEFVFYDGPPFANGLPHYGHLLTGFVKDLFPRYQTMKGKRVERRFGWDCHGLPAEMGAEKELGISGSQAIKKFGIDNFNNYCRTSVMKYTSEWEDYVTRQARWVDFQNDYKTMDTSFMESTIWAFKQLYDKGMVYEAYRVMPYSWAAETPLSNFETRLDNSYRDREDKAVTVAFELLDRPDGAPDADKYYLLAWTTTPWTLPSNLALAVKPDMEYQASFLSHMDQKICLFAENAYLEKIFEQKITDLRDFGKAFFSSVEHITYTPVESVFGDKLLGLRYKPLFPYFANRAYNQGEVVGSIIETKRLYLRAFSEDDYKLYHSLQADPKVVATTSDGLLPEEKIRSEFERFLKDQKTKGFTQWGVFRKEDNAFIGRAGFDNRDYDQFNTSGQDDVELRYALLSDYWGQGYAGEAANAVLEWGVRNLTNDLIIAGCNPTYNAAVKLLKKLGFASHHEVPFRNQSVLYHTMSLAEWAKNNKPTSGAFRVLAGDFIEEGSGTGVVHMAPGFGEDDMRVCVEAGIEVVCPVDQSGRFTDAVYDLPNLSIKGLNVIAEKTKADNEPYKQDQLDKFGLVNLRIIDWLKHNGSLIKNDTIKHSYPHCWRTDQPLIYRAMPSWYVEVTKFKDRMVELNQQINWIPGHVKDGLFGKWLENARDWSISRNRFWGTPIPVWRSKSGKVKVFGSIDELEKASGKKITDLHRPFIDEVVINDGGEEYRRVEDVFDCWFESGSMPYGQVHYPFERGEWFRDHNPADFIVEYAAQTRGWFYTLMVLGVALFDKPPFLNCICHGVVLDDKGQKLSKRLNNYADPRELFKKYGADALRWFMMASPVMRGLELHIDKEGLFIRDAVRLYIKPLWNAYNFFALYANADGIKGNLLSGGKAENPMDAYILAKLKIMVEAVERALDAYDTPATCQVVSEFLEVLNNWYIRRSKERFWKSEKDADKQAAYDTLYTVLHVLSRACAPMLPMVCEEIYSGLVNGGKKDVKHSVHLTDWPDVSFIVADAGMVEQMDKVRDVCNAALSVRNALNIRVRQPLSSLTVVGSGSFDGLWQETIKDEINVKKLASEADTKKYAELKLSINSAVLGKRRPDMMKQVIPASKKGEWEMKAGRLHIAGIELDEGEYTLQLEPKADYKTNAQALSTNDALVILDVNVTPELEAEGIARDLVRMVQEARKSAKLNVTDRISLSLKLPEKIEKAAKAHESYIADQVLAESVNYSETSADYKTTQALDGAEVTIGIKIFKQEAA